MNSFLVGEFKVVFLYIVVCDFLLVTKNGLKGTVPHRPVSSWSFSHEIARGFAAQGSPNFSEAEPYDGVVFAAMVPIEDVVSISPTGFGSLLEQEVVVTGSFKGPVEVHEFHPPLDDADEDECDVDVNSA